MPALPTHLWAQHRGSAGRGAPLRGSRRLDGLDYAGYDSGEEYEIGE